MRSSQVRSIRGIRSTYSAERGNVMAVESKQVETREEDYKCDTCNEGHMRSTGMILTSYPPQYPHICNSCGAAKTFRVTYPRIVHVELS